MPRQTTDPTDQPEAVPTAVAAPVSDAEGFFEHHVKILVPAMMAHADTIQSHSPDARRSFLAILARTGSIPSYGMPVKPKTAPRQADNWIDDTNAGGEYQGTVSF